MRLAILLSLIVCLSCKDQAVEWWKQSPENWPQIVLTNHLNFKGRKPVTGASAFFLSYKGDTVVCTARHVIEKPIGIVPSVPLDSANLLLNKWLMAPRATPGFDSINVSHIRSTTSSELDFLVLDANTKASGITPLSPSEGMPNIENKVYIIGCERSDTECSQNVYPAKVSRVEPRQIIIQPNSTFNPMGFSGAPVVTANGKVSGIVFGTYNGEEGFYLYLVPIQQVLNHL